MWMLFALLLITGLPVQGAAICLGDCDGDGRVVASEIVRLVGIAIDEFPESTCPAGGVTGDHMVTVDEIVGAVSSIFFECPRSPIPTASPTASPSPTPTDSPSATPSASSSPTPSLTPSHTATSITATPSRTLTPSPTSTPSATATPTNTPPSTATATLTPTATQFPVGVFVGGKVAILSAGLGNVQSIVAAILTTMTNGGTAPLISPGVQAPPEHRCPVSGGTSRDCTLMGTGNSKTIHLVLGADNCVTAGLWGGTAAFNGMITVDSTPFFTNTCGPPPSFTSASFKMEGPPDDPGQGFVTVLRDGMMNQTEYITWQGDGMVSVTPATGTACLINGMTLTLKGGMHSQRADGSEIFAEFNDASVAMDQIIFNQASCVPIDYRLKFSGDVQVSAMFPGTDFSTGLGASLTNFFLTQDATGTRTLSDVDGQLSSDCFGSAALQPIASLSVAPGTLCPLTGQFTASGSGAMATVTYEDGQVVVQQVGTPQAYADCSAEDLQMCLPQ